MPVIYIGPNQLKLGLKQNTIYEEYPKEFVEGLKGEYPLAGRLFVPSDKLGAAMENAAKKGTPEYLAMKQMEVGD
ncbi:MAG: hypothetical protein IJT01_04995 [Selenomonadaceae bacterium]|nr:hypothetical protein [Selenomonadaceae bacterium]